MSQGKVKNFLQENSHIWYSLILLPILLSYVVVEHFVTDTYTATYIPLDDWIPFWEGAVIGYGLWFVLLVGTGFALMFGDADGFRRYMVCLGTAFLLAGVIFLLFPTGQELRPETVEGNSLCAQAVRYIYRVDTNTNVCPSMHVTAAAIAAHALWVSPTLGKPAVRATGVTVAAVTALSTVFVKQHSAVDLILALPYAAIVICVCYHTKVFKKLASGGKNYGHK